MKIETNKKRIEDIIDGEVEKKLKEMNVGTQQIAQIQPVQDVGYEICGGPHLTI
jgi:hypothetical protein